MEQTPLLRVDKLSVSFEDNLKNINAINSLSFSINEGETFALLGESGCGKSLTALSIIQLLANNAFVHRESAIYFKDKLLLDMPESQWQSFRGRHIAMIFQEPMTSLNPVLTIQYQLQEAIGHREHIKGEALENRLLELLSLVELGERPDILSSYPHQLSGGQKQRIMIAMALAGRPSLLIADEPTTALDVTVEAQILNLLKKLQQTLNMSILLITHDLSVVKRLAHRVGVMYAGEMVECADVADIMSNSKHPYTKELLHCLPSLSKRGSSLDVIEGVVPPLTAMPSGCRFKERCFARFSSCDEHPLLHEDKHGHLVRCHYYTHHVSSAMPAAKKLPKEKNKIETSNKNCLTIKNLSVNYPVLKGLLRRQVDAITAVDNISLEIQCGETVAVVGESGCGKTTLSKAIVGLQLFNCGEIHFMGKAHHGPNQQIQMVFQDPFSSMNPRMLVEDILLEGVTRERDKVKNERLAKHLLDLVGLPQQSLHRYPHQFSGGQRQRLSIARALAMNPKLLICDEPTSALDVSIQAQILNLLKQLQDELGIAYLFISHDLNVVSYLADRIYVMKKGQFIEQGEAISLLKSPQNAYTQQLLHAKQQNIIG